MLRFSTSAWLLLTVYYFFDFQDIKESSNLMAYPVIECLVLGHAAQSASQNAVKLVVEFLDKNIPKPGHHLIYLITLNAAS